MTWHDAVNWNTSPTINPSPSPINQLCRKQMSLRGNVKEWPCERYVRFFTCQPLTGTLRVLESTLSTKASHSIDSCTNISIYFLRCFHINQILQKILLQQQQPPCNHHHVIEKCHPSRYSGLQHYCC